MRPALLLVDFQQDFLQARCLEPAAGEVVERAAVLLGACRALGVPVVHVWTTVRAGDDRRMPHWRENGLWRCVAGTPGHETPSPLAPRADERVVHKTDYSAFAGTDLAQVLSDLGVDAVLVAGLHLHACVRATVLDAYARRLGIHVAEDAVASDDPLHAAATRLHLAARGTRFRTVDEIVRVLSPHPARGTPAGSVPLLPALFVGGCAEDGRSEAALAHESPAHAGTVLWRVPLCRSGDVARATAAARAALTPWSETSPTERQRVLARFADRLAEAGPDLADAIVRGVGKPVVLARAEVARAGTLLRTAAQVDAGPGERPCGSRSFRRDRPVGVVAIVTPWNNPLAIAAGKLGPALAYGNVVVWKPAIQGAEVALRVMELAVAAGVPPGVIGLCCGDRATAAAVMADGAVDAVAITGSSLAGYAAQAICGRRRIPLQAELGGNNAALVAADADLAAAARAVADGAFWFAGQRCTANRRVIVESRCIEAFTGGLVDAVSQLSWGRPGAESTLVGPLIGAAARSRVDGVVARALARGASPCGRLPGDWPEADVLAREGAYAPPVVLRCDDPDAEVVQEETFGPVLVLQPAADWRDAIRLANGVRQGLVASAFTRSPERRAEFLRDVQAGMLKLDQSTADADAEAPFGGWKASGVGPPERGDGDRAFFTRTQAVYR